MSKSNASAKNRRAFGGNPPPPTPSPVPSQSNGAGAGGGIQAPGFTLQQVIAVIDHRLLNLENFMNESKDTTSRHVKFEQSVGPSTDAQPQVDSSVHEILNEFNSRFELIAEELGTLKDIVLKLQSYTMDVNKTLLEERIRVFSDLGADQASLDAPIYDISNEVINQEQTQQQATNSVDLKNLVKEEFSQSS